ncbi:MAG: YbaB/EbfC family nucleoid-associated protein [Gammaproteobacteria bacterium]|nr:YbaB/EbfC family nucleoid-associated protein [Gammaproteobacteria bacterium]MDE2344836.1 YbaB/EbfC family nucleoid-associated protein [Gammaproteobacteria bacterium]
MKNGIGGLLKQAQQLKANMEKAQEELARLEVTGTAGGGMVSVVMTGRHDVRRVSIDPKIAADDREMLEDLIAAAINDAVNKIDTVTRERFAGFATGMPLPDGLKLPF